MAQLVRRAMLIGFAVASSALTLSAASSLTHGCNPDVDGDGIIRFADAVLLAEAIHLGDAASDGCFANDTDALVNFWQSSASDVYAAEAAPPPTPPPSSPVCRHNGVTSSGEDGDFDGNGDFEPFDILHVASVLKDLATWLVELPCMGNTKKGDFDNNGDFEPFDILHVASVYKNLASWRNPA